MKTIHREGRRWHKDAKAIILKGVGEKGDVRQGYCVSYPTGERSSAPRFLTDSREKALELAHEKMGWYGSEGSVQYAKMVCLGGGAWTICDEVYEDGSSEDMEELRRKAIAKLTEEERKALGVE